MPKRIGKPSRVPRHFIREWLRHRGLTQGRLAERLDVSPPTVSRIVNGKQKYTQGTLEAIAEALACEPADLLMRDPNSPLWSIVDSLKRLPPEKQDQIAKIIETFSEAA